MKETKETKTILVTGDVSIDHLITIGDRKFSDSLMTEQGTCISNIYGGARLVYDFIKIFENSKNIRFGLDLKIFKKLPAQNNSYATISKYIEEKDNKKENKWRIKQQFGFGSFTNAIDYGGIKAITDLSEYDLVVIDDASMDFSSHVNKKAVWPAIETFYSKKGKGLIIYKKSGDIKKGELFKELLDASEKEKIDLLSIISINDIRRQDARVSAKISWEQSALDLVYEIKNNVNLVGLLKSKFVIITLQSSGAILITKKKKDEYEYKLLFDPKHLEDEWESKIDGDVIGRLSCFTASVAANIKLDKPDKNFKIEDAIIKGLQSIRGFFNIGYAEKTWKIKIKDILNASAKHSNIFSQANIPVPTNSSTFLDCDWTILKDNYLDINKTSKIASEPLFEMARNVVLNGRTVLNNVPSMNLRKLFTVDRNEIESLRNIKILIENYKEQKKENIPLSIAVFGLPGSGKSFGVKEIGKGVLGEKLPILEFNLSQFNDASDLIGAFHQIRDEVLKGDTPLVFWDEFDSQNYKWLQFLLAPMQDGTFQEGQVTHTIGKCIMVFAGGTSYKMEYFGVYDEISEKEKFEEFILKKGPDFISRINGYINILGPNPSLIRDAKTKKWVVDSFDICYPVRRALFIRQIIGLKDGVFLNIDWGLMNALLKVEKYKHGSRSLVNLLKTLIENSGGRKILRCHLPSNAILKLYIDNLENFFIYLNENKGYHENVFKIAPAIHQVWMDKSITKNPDYEKEFDALPVFIKASNVDAAIRIPKVLAVAKLKIVSKTESICMSSSEYSNYIKEHNNKYLDKMAEQEHKLWMEFYYNNDWHYNKDRNDYKKLHNCLVDFHDPLLTDGDRQKDKDQVEKFWNFLNEVGFGIAKEK